MCWYSAELAERTLQAEVGQRLVIRKVHGSGWVVQEKDLEKPRPAPVCLLDHTKVLFRFQESEQSGVPSEFEAEAVFRMLKRPKRDVFQFNDGREIDMNALSAGLVFDVLEVPGKEELSKLLKPEVERREDLEPAIKRESLLERVLAFF